MRPNPAIRFEREGPLRVVGHLWTQTSPGLWVRHICRRHADSRDMLFSLLTFVDASKEYCPRCLSNEVMETKQLFNGSVTMATPWYDCRECGMHWRYVPEPGKLEG